jgi:uncharacterized protein (TIGR02118 family)
MYRMTITYTGDADARFDFDYYCSKHMPMVADFYGDIVEKWEVSKGMSDPMGGPAPYIAIGQFWLNDLGPMKAAMKEHGREIMADIPNYTDMQPVIQIEEVLAVPQPA